MVAVSRRQFARAVGLLAAGQPSGAQAVTAVALRNQQYSSFRGFNYQPSWGSTGLEIWMRFNAGLMDVELARGKKYFPGINAIRLWLSWDAFMRSPSRFEEHFERALDVAHKYELKVMPVLFNRWHDVVLDYGGIYLDHFLPGLSRLQTTTDLFRPYMEAIVGKHASDSRVFSWDLCNEPFTYADPTSRAAEQAKAAEMTWLETLYKTCKGLGARAPITVGFHHRTDMIEPLSDVFSIHPYWGPRRENLPVKESRANYEDGLDARVRIANKFNKPLLATETCWGSLDDPERVEIIRYTLNELKKRNIGWLAYLLHHSLIADAHRPEYGPVGVPGDLAFIEANGALRAGHEVFNEF